MQFTFRKAIPCDTLRLSVLFKTVYIETYGLEGVTTEFSNFINEQFSEDKVSQMINSDKVELLVALYKDNPIGIAKVDYKRTCPIGKIRGPELNKLYVLNRFIGKGIGYQLLEKAEAILKEKGEKEIWLWVYLKNERANRFYERQNYKWIGNAFFQMNEDRYENKVFLKQL